MRVQESLGLRRGILGLASTSPYELSSTAVTSPLRDRWEEEIRFFKLGRAIGAQAMKSS